MIILPAEEALAPKATLDPCDKLPKECHEFLDGFSKKEANKLPGGRQTHRLCRLVGGTPSLCRRVGGTNSQPVLGPLS